MYADDGDLLLMAGLWSTWRPKGESKDTAPLLSCTIITTDSAGPLADIHDRMPLTVSARDWDHWLDPDAPIDEGLLRGHGDLDRIAIRRCRRWSTASATTARNSSSRSSRRAEQAGLFMSPCQPTRRSEPVLMPRAD